MIDLLCLRAEQQPENIAYTFLQNGEALGAQWSYRELHERAKVIGALLQHQKAAGERVLLLYPPGLEFIAAFWGCMYAGAIAVPVYPPQNKRHLTRIQGIVDDAQAGFLLTVPKTRNKIRTWLEHSAPLASIRLLVTDELPEERDSQWSRPSPCAEDLAFLQYTSGSTASPKGVMVSHGNLLHNLAQIQRRFEASPESIGVSWLPPYHDMGLIGGLLQPLYVGFPIVLMSPGAFLQRPLRWLKAISDYRATVSGGPNFAYDLCASKISAEHRESLDLRYWKIAFSGAEPVQINTLESFATLFEPCGFRANVFYPCYGLAEATLFVSGGKKTSPPVIQCIDSESFETQAVARPASHTEKGRQLVGVGQLAPDQTLRIVEPESLRPCSPGQIGEIWLAGPSVTQGYWKNADATREYFQAYVAESGEGPFLRTGDLGFIVDGELFVTGRRKDMLIVRGRNYYPHDIENIIEHCHVAVRRHSLAAISVTNNREEQLVIIAEVERRYIHSLRKQKIRKYAEQRHPVDPYEHFEEAGFSLDFDHAPDFNDMITAIRQAVVEEFGLLPYAVILIKATTIPRTSSGKIQHYACKNAFLDGTLDVIAEWRSVKQQIHDTAKTTVERSGEGRTILQKLDNAPRERQRQLVMDHMQTLISRVLLSETSDINEQCLLSSFGIDSLMAAELHNHILSDLHVEIPLEWFLESHTLAELLDCLQQELALKTLTGADVFDAQGDDDMEEIIL